MNNNTLEIALKGQFLPRGVGLLTMVTKVLLATYIWLHLDFSSLMTSSQTQGFALSDASLLFGIMSVFFLIYSSITPLVRYMGVRASGVSAKHVSTVYCTFGVLSFLLFIML